MEVDFECMILNIMLSRKTILKINYLKKTMKISPKNNIQINRYIKSMFFLPQKKNKKQQNNFIILLPIQNLI